MDEEIRHSNVSRNCVNKQKDVRTMTTLVEFARQKVTWVTEATMAGHIATLHRGASPAKRIPLWNSARKKKKVMVSDYGPFCGCNRL